MTEEEYIQFLRSVVTTAKIDALTEASVTRIQNRFAIALDETMGALMTPERGPEELQRLAAQFQRLSIQSDAVQILTNDLADLTAASGMIAYPDYNNMVSWDGRVKDFNSVARTAAELKEQALTAQMGDKTLDGWVETLFGPDKFDDNTRAAMVDAMEISRAKGEGYRQMVARMSREFHDVTRDNLTTIARSYTQAMNVQAQTDVYEANPDVVKGVKWTAVLENGNTATGTGTCPRCAALDGEEFILKEVNSGAGEYPNCPLHPRCRCLLLPVTKTWRDLGFDVDEMEEAYRPYMERTEEAIGAGGRRDILDVWAPEYDEFGNLVNRAGYRTYKDYWTAQSESFQDAAVGVQRARLIRNGDLGFNTMVVDEFNYDDFVSKGLNLRAGDLIPIKFLGLDDATLYFARTGRWPDDPKPGKITPPKPPPVAPAPATPPTPVTPAESGPGIDRAPSLSDVEAHLKPYQDAVKKHQDETIALINTKNRQMDQLKAETDPKERARIEARLRNTQKKLDVAFVSAPDTAPLNEFRDYIKPPKGGTLDWSRGRGTQTVAAWDDIAREAEDWFHPDILDNLPPVEIRFINGRRAGYMPNEDYFTMGNKDRGTYLHELSHHIEWYTGLYPKMKAFRKSRTVGEPKIQVGPPGENGWKDKFYNAYAGKDYEPMYQASEILSMGVEKMYRDPYGFYLDDPEYFELTLKAMWNEL